jgi:LDH2 family malate/lactate/ureidoglycolate dehydrogenase
MVPWGGAEAMLGNNPFAIAYPAGREWPIVLDMACSVAARGKIIVAAKEGRPIPADWAIGPDGAPTTDARVALEGFVAPVGGAKGYALTLAIGLMSTMLSGAAFGREMTHMYDELDRPQNVGHAFAALPIAAFEDPDVYARRMEKAIADIRSVKLAPGVERVYLPGEREALLLQQRRRDGIPIGQGVYTELVAVGVKLGIGPLSEI